MVVYVLDDPFKVLYHYNSYYGRKTIILLNRDYVSTETFIRNNPIYHYDSFIFGSSRSEYYCVSDWQKYISSNNCFHFSAQGESIYGIFLKIKYLNTHHVPIKNAIIPLDFGTLKNVTETKGHLFLEHPALSGRN